jgi:hypothetical protein
MTDTSVTQLRELAERVEAARETLKPEHDWLAIHMDARRRINGILKETATALRSLERPQS